MNYKEKNYLGRNIEIADVKAQYDTYAKKIISDRTLLSWIAKYAIQELKDYNIEEICSCIKGEPEIAVTPDYLADTIVQYSIKPESIIGEIKGNSRYDLMSAVMIYLNAKSHQSKETLLHGLLGTIFSEKLNFHQKEIILNQDYNIETAKVVKEGMSSMCNLSDAIEERGIRKGLEQGLQLGREKMLMELVCRKIKKNKDVATIAEELEEDESVIQRIYDIAVNTVQNN